MQKLYYIGPQFRRERPQKGRYRQFLQIGAEVIGPPSAGSESPLRDAEVLEMLAALLDELGITGWRLLINSVGSSADRPRYIDGAALSPRARQGPNVRGLPAPRGDESAARAGLKDPEDQPIIDDAAADRGLSRRGLEGALRSCADALDACGVPYHVNHRLVRGLDYYTRTTFEFQHGGLGAQNALLGGGRYDGLRRSLAARMLRASASPSAKTAWC